MQNFLIFGTILGLSAGFAPGPLLTLVISETLKYDIKAGMKVAIAPVLTDIPIILVSFFAVAKLSEFQSFLGILSMAGGILVIYIGVGSIRSKGMELNPGEVKSYSLSKGMIVNLLNPHPYLFWFGVGAPTMLKALNASPASAISFVGGFYVMLLGSKILLALVTEKSRSFLSGPFYKYTLRFLGLLLCVFGIMLIHDGIGLLNH